MVPKKKKILVKTFSSVSEVEARGLLQMVLGRAHSIVEPIRNRMLELISKGQRYGLVSAEDADHNPLSPEDSKKYAVQLNLNMKKSGFEVRYISPRDSFLFVPTEKFKEMLGKAE